MRDVTINDAVTKPGDGGTLLANRYRIIRQLGQGGMGSVWLAEDMQLDNKQFAIKMLPPILVSNKRAYRQLKDEALVAMKLTHPNIVTLRAFEENGGNPFLVMDYIDGETLDDYLYEKCKVENVKCKVSGGLSEDEVIRLLKPIAAALDYAHGEGVVHRDVKPANVMIRKDGHPFILDFGIAREMQETMTRVTGKLSSGTLLYMSPEQLNGDRPSPSQDVYSFAAMTYECLKGEPPFARGQIEYQIINNTPPPLNDPAQGSGSSVSADLAESVMAGLAKTPERRPQSCKDVLEWTVIKQRREEKKDAELKKRIAAEREYAAMRARLEAQERAAAERVRKLREPASRLGPIPHSKITPDDRSISKNVIVCVVAALFIVGAVFCVKTARTSTWRNATPPLKIPTTTKIIKPASDSGGQELPSEPTPVKGIPASMEETPIPSPATVKPVADVPEKSIPTLEERARGGDVAAQYELAKQLYEGNDIVKDIVKSLHWAVLAAAGGSAEAEYLAGIIYFEGKGGVSQDCKKAVGFFQGAFAKGIAEAAFQIGRIYERGLESAPDDVEASKWYGIGDERGVPVASNNLGLMYLEGRGVKTDYGKARRLFEKALEKCVWVAAFNLGCMYEDGCGVPVDLEEAKRYFKIVVNNSPDLTGIVASAKKKIGDIDIQTVPLNKLKPEIRVVAVERGTPKDRELSGSAGVSDVPKIQFSRNPKCPTVLIVRAEKLSDLLNADMTIVHGSKYCTFTIEESDIRICQKKDAVIRAYVTEPSKPILHLTASLGGDLVPARIIQGVVDDNIRTPCNITIDNNIGERNSFKVEYTRNGIRYEGAAELVARAGYSHHDISLKMVRYCSSCLRDIKGSCLDDGKCPFCHCNLRDF